MIVQHFYVNSTEKRETKNKGKLKAESLKTTNVSPFGWRQQHVPGLWRYLKYGSIFFFFAHGHQVHVCMTLVLSCPGTEWFKCSGSHQLRAIGMHKYQKLWCFNIVKYCCWLDLSAVCSFHQLQTVARCHEHYHVYTHSVSHSPFPLWSALVSHWPICMEILCISVVAFCWSLVESSLSSSSNAIYLAAFGFCLSCKFDASSLPMDASLNSHDSM